MTAEWPHTLVDDHFAGRSDAEGDRALWRHLPACDRCRARYRSRALLESLEPDGGDRARERLARGVFARRRPPRALWAGALTAAAAAVVLLVAWPSRDRFSPRGGAETSVTPAGPALSIFRATPGGGAERVGAVVRAGDSLAFSYVNPPLIAATHLMVFAVDGAGHVYWFWPAWTSPATDPQAVPIAASPAPIELPEAIRHQLPPGRLTVHALFARHAYRVREVEAAATGQALGTLNGVLVTEPLEVTP